MRLPKTRPACWNICPIACTCCSAGKREKLLGLALCPGLLVGVRHRGEISHSRRGIGVAKDINPLEPQGLNHGRGGLRREASCSAPRSVPCLRTANGCPEEAGLRNRIGREIVALELATDGGRWKKELRPYRPLG